MLIYDYAGNSAVWDSDPKKRLQKEEARASKPLKGKVVKEIKRFRPEEVVVVFEDGTIFSFDWRDNEFDLSITGDFSEDD